MPTLVQFGAGNIGRGFIAPLFSAAGWRVVFVEVDVTRLEALRKRDGYIVHEVDSHGRDHRREVAPVDAVDGGDPQAVAAALAEADLAATAVGLRILPAIAPAIADGLRQRQLPLDILVCENGATAAEDLHAAISNALGHHHGASFGCVRTSIGRMVPPSAGTDPLDLTTEPYAHLPVERRAFRGPIPDVPGLEPQEDFDAVIACKLYLHNASHAALAFAGSRAGHATIPDAMDDPVCAGLCEAVLREGVQTLHAAFGPDCRAQAETLAADLPQRYRNRHVGDPIARVAADPRRKLGRDDRLVGLARLARQHGIATPATHLAILAACRHPQPEDAQWCAWDGDHRATLAHCAHLEPEDPLMNQIDIAARRQEAADRIHAAGIALRGDEIPAIEIADFGLGRFHELGLAIHVYVNTDRCCAKELAMLPGQVCPEHMHPDVDGEAGKEETFRVRAGTVIVYTPGDRGDAAMRAEAEQHLPPDYRGSDAFSGFQAHRLEVGDQLTISPRTRHWFVAGPQGAVVSEFSTRSRDEADLFTDPAIVRVPDDGTMP